MSWSHNHGADMSTISTKIRLESRYVWARAYRGDRTTCEPAVGVGRGGVYMQAMGSKHKGEGDGASDKLNFG